MRRRIELRADAAYVAAFSEILARVESALGPLGRRAPVRVFVAGGAAVHLYTGERISKDIDASVEARFLPPENLQVSYRGRDGHARLLYFDTQYHESYALLHEDAHRDAIPIALKGVDPRRLDVRLLSPLDLAVSKLSRFELHDREDILALGRLGLVEAKSLRARAGAALPGYVGVVDRVRNSIDIACRLLKSEEKKRAKPAGA